MHLVRAIRDPQRAQVRPHVRERGVLAHAHGAIGLDGAVNDLQRDLGHFDLGLRDLLERELGVPLVRLDGGVEHDESAGVDLDARLGDPLEQHAVFGQALAKGDLALVVEAVDEPLEGLLRGPDAAHGVVDAARAQAALHDLVAAALAQDDGVEGHAHVGEGDVAVAVGGVVVAVDAEHAVHRDARRVGGDEHHGLPLVLVRVVGVGLAHGDEDLAPVVARAGRPPFAAVEEVVVPLAFHAELDVGAVRRRNVRFRHEESRPDLSGHEGLEPPFLLSRAAVACDDFHVACIWRGTVACLDNNKRVRDEAGKRDRVYRERLTSLAVILLPNCSAIRPYSTFVNCGPSLKWFFGKNMFHIPRLLALRLRSSIWNGSGN